MDRSEDHPSQDLCLVGQLQDQANALRVLADGRADAVAALLPDENRTAVLQGYKGWFISVSLGGMSSAGR